MATAGFAAVVATVATRHHRLTAANIDNKTLAAIEASYAEDYCRLGFPRILGGLGPAGSAEPWAECDREAQTPPPTPPYYSKKMK